MSGVMRRAPARLAVWATLAATSVGGCTAESTRIALQAQQRAAEIDEAVFERQHEGLKILLFRETLQRLGAAQDESSPTPILAAGEAEGAAGGAAALSDVLNRAWNERDLIEFWALQHERAKALRLIGVDAKLFSEQAVIDLLIKAATAKADRARQGLAAAQVVARLTTPTVPSESETKGSKDE